MADSILEGSTVQCKIASDLPMLIECLKHLTKSNSTVVCSSEEFGEHIVARTGELHLKISLKGLQDDFMGDSKIIKYDPVVFFRATVLEGSFCTVMRKSLHKHNRLYMEEGPRKTDSLRLLITAASIRGVSRVDSLVSLLKMPFQILFWSKVMLTKVRENCC